MPERDGEPSGQSALLNTAGSIRSLNPVHARFSGAGTQTSRDASQSDRDLLEENRDGAAGVAVQVRVTDGSDHDYLLPYPCKLMEGTWVNAASGTPLAVRPTYWKLYVETLPGKKAWKRRPPAELSLLAIALWGCLF
jgi:hypothetical protein